VLLLPTSSRPPDTALTELRAIRGALDLSQIPDRHVDRNLLVATWNIRAFGDLAEKWDAGPGDRPKRDLHALLLIAEIVSRFDVIAIQEVKGNIKALRWMLRMLGPDWGLILTDVSRGDPGNNERLAFVFDTRRVKPSGLAGELVIPSGWARDRRIRQDALEEQFARTPYAVSFISGGQTFILVTLHVIYGKKSSDRLAELRGIAEWLADWARRTSEDYRQNLIALGDFNIDREGDETYEAFTSTGLQPPKKLRGLPRTIYDRPDRSHFYDQIAWFRTGDEAALTLEHSGRAGNFDFRGHVYPTLGPSQLSARVSDHLPLWAEFMIPREGSQT
jgi:endonuclease/exonuclease/phosphatase family metal-dependent hydrolase